MTTVWALFKGEPAGQDHTLCPFVHPHFVCKCDNDLVQVHCCVTMMNWQKVLSL